MTTALNVKPAASGQPLLIGALLVALVLGVFAAAQFWPVVAGFFNRSAPKADAPSMTEVPALPAIDPKLALIGTDASLSASPLDLILVATSPGRNANEGTASLGVDARNPQVYVAGALLSNGARLVEVHFDRVVLERGGSRAELRVGATIANPLDNPEGLKGALDRNPKASDPSLLRVGGSSSSSPASGTQPSASSVDEVSERVRAAPHFESGALAGFRVYPGERTSSFSALGLQSGDIVRAVAGQRLTSEAQWTEVAYAIADGNPVNVTIERDGALMGLTLDAAAAATAPPPSSMMPPSPPPPGGAP